MHAGTGRPGSIGATWTFTVALSTLPVGPSVGECFVRLYFLECACQAQIFALSAGEDINNPPQGAPEVAAEQGAMGVTIAARLLAWPALLRKAYRLDPSFAS